MQIDNQKNATHRRSINTFPSLGIHKMRNIFKIYVLELFYGYFYKSYELFWRLLANHHPPQ